MGKLTLYQKPTCTKCRQLKALLEKKGIEFDSVNYFTDPVSARKLAELVKKAGVPAREFVRDKEDKFRELKLRDKDLSDREWVDLMVKYPELMQRPIAEHGNRAVLARPVEKIEEIL